MKKYTIKNSDNKITRIVVILLWLGIWQATAMIVDNDLLFPSLFKTIYACFDLLKTGSFYIDAVTTIGRCLGAIIISLVLGLIFAHLSSRFSLLKTIMSVPVSFFKTVPVMAIIIYLIIIVSSGWVSILVAFLMCFPVVYTNVLFALENVDTKLKEVTQIYELSQIQNIKHLYFPSIKPAIKSSVSLISGLSWKAIIAAEVLSVPRFSLGYEMMNAKYYLNTAQLFAYILVIILLSLLMERIINLLMNRKEETEYFDSKLNFCGKSYNDIQKLEKLEITQLVKAFNEKQVIENFSLCINEKETIGLLAPSGSGKTTLVRMISGLEKLDGGKVEYKGDCQISFLFQEDRLFPWLNVYDNIKIGLIGKSRCHNSSEIHDEILKIAKTLKIEDVLYKMPTSLSGGMKHRVALGRTFVSKCDLLIFDEPFRGLDNELKDSIISNLWEDKTRDKITILISHNINDLHNLCDKTIRL